MGRIEETGGARIRAARKGFADETQAKARPSLAYNHEQEPPSDWAEDRAEVLACMYTRTIYHEPEDDVYEAYSTADELPDLATSLRTRRTRPVSTARYRLEREHKSTHSPSCGVPDPQPTRRVRRRGPTRTDSRTPRTTLVEPQADDTPHASGNTNSTLASRIPRGRRMGPPHHVLAPDPSWNSRCTYVCAPAPAHFPPPSPTSPHLPQPPTTSHVPTSHPYPASFLFPHYRRDHQRAPRRKCEHRPPYQSTPRRERCHPPRHTIGDVYGDRGPPPRPNNLDRTQYRPPHRPSRIQTPRRPRMASSPSRNPSHSPKRALEPMPIRPDRRPLGAGATTHPIYMLRAPLVAARIRQIGGRLGPAYPLRSRQLRRLLWTRILPHTLLHLRNPLPRACHPDLRSLRRSSRALYNKSSRLRTWGPHVRVTRSSRRITHKLSCEKPEITLEDAHFETCFARNLPRNVIPEVLAYWWCVSHSVTIYA